MTLQSLHALRVPDDVETELIVVANACSDDTVAVVNECAPTLPLPIRCVIEPAPGLSRARNRGVAESAGHIVAFLEDDVRVEPDWLEGLLRGFRELPADLIGGRIHLWWRDVQRPAWMPEEVTGLLSANDKGDRPFELTHMSGFLGGNCAYRREVYDTVGAYNENLGRIGTSLGAMEEGEFLMRGYASGYRAFYCPWMTVHHLVSPNRLRRSYLFRAAFGQARSRVIAKLHFGPYHFARCVIGNLYLTLCGLLMAGLALLARNRPQVTRHMTLAASGAGGLLAIPRRIIMAGNPFRRAGR